MPLGSLKNKHRLFKQGLLLLLIISLCVQYFYFRKKVDQDHQKAIARAEQSMEKAQKSFSKRLQELMEVADVLADKISNQSIDSTEIMSYLKDNMEKNHDVFGFGVGFEPYKYSKERRLWAPFYIRPNDSLKLELIEESYDYSVKDWYTRPLHEGAAWYDPPYLGVISQKLMAEYSVPFYGKDSLGNRIPIGIVYLDYTMEDMTKAIQSLNLGKSGYGFMFSKGGTQQPVMIAHPIANYIKEARNIEQFASEWENEGIKPLFQNDSSSRYIELNNPANGSLCLMFSRQVPESGWKMGAIFVEDAFKPDIDFVNRSILIMITTIVLILILFILILIGGSVTTYVTLRKSVPWVSIVLLCGTVAIWLTKVSQPYNLFQQNESYPITEKSVLEKFITSEDSLRTYYKEPPLIRIPTGVFVKHVEFDGSHNIRFSGIIWQKYAHDLDTSVIQPNLFFFATAPDAEALNFERIYTKKGKDYTSVGWYFRLEVRERLYYNLYPFDREIVKLTVSHPQLDQHIQLVPDLESYSSISPTSLPGVDHDLVLPDWQLEESFFDYNKNMYGTDFGVMSHFDNDHQNDLRFNIVLRRKFFWPFMTNLIPLATITVILFLAILTISKREQSNKPMAFSSFGFLELCTALLFVAILTHIDLRSTLNVNYVIYMDYFYFHVYLLIISYSINAVIYAKRMSQTGHMTSRSVYWPFLLGSLYLFTLVIFY